LRNVKAVRKMGDNTYHWVAEIGGVNLEWDARVTTMKPNQVIAWNSISADNKNSGEVRFSEMSGGTHLYVTLIYDPPAGVLSELADKVTRRMDSQVEEDLENFKKTVEANYAHQGAHRMPS
jgi:uncharacterized membrane protein